MYCGTSAIPQLTCCDLFGNEGGNWTGLIADLDVGCIPTATTRTSWSEVKSQY